MLTSASGSSLQPLILGWALFACSSPTPPTYDVDLELQADTVWITRSPNEVRIGVPVVVRNQDERPLYLTPCGHVLQVENAGRWTTVWSSPCAPGSLYSLELSPGESTLLTLGTRSAIASNSWPATAEAGTYRAVLSLTAVPLNTGGIAPAPLAADARTTQPFSVRVRTVVF